MIRRGSMNNYLFYSYLKWQKDNNDSSIKKLLKLPKPAIVLLILLSISCITTIILLFIQLSLSYIALAFEFIIVVITFFYSERMLIKTSINNLESYRNYCFKLYTWICTFSVTEKEDINELMNRILESKNNLAIIKVRQLERIDRWMQVLVIPIVLAIVNNLISKQTDINQVTVYILTILALFATIYFFIYAAIAAMNIFNKKKINQYQSFADDLQGIIDVKFGMLSGNDK